MSDTVARIFPIPRSILEEERRFFRGRSWGGLTKIEVLNDGSSWRDAGFSVPYVIDLGVRSLESQSGRHRDAYRAGGFIGTVLVRDRIHFLAQEGLRVETPTESPISIDWSAMQASRFLLSPLIEGDGEFDPKPILRGLEMAWDAQESMDAATRPDEPANGLTNLPADDWVIVGMGDVLASYADRFDYSRALIQTVPLAPEFRIAAL